MRTLLVALTGLVMTPPCAAALVIAALLRRPDRPGSVIWRTPRLWSRSMLWAAGVKVRLHGGERIAQPPASQVFACNHVSWYDVFALAGTLPRYSFIAKAELLRIPIFGPGARAAGTIPIERDNRKSAFSSYEQAAGMIRGGQPVVVFPEGTRGRTYALRPFKKGPFVLAIAAQAPIAPVVVHGALEVMPKGSWLIRPGVVDIHILEPIPTAGLTYEDRDTLSTTVHARMAAMLASEYGVGPAPEEPSLPAAASA
jgi:1-acyl-sn-glycerol-3-phosphate acyltransferase